MESDDENQDHQKPKKLYKCNLCEKKFTRKKSNDASICRIWENDVKIGVPSKEEKMTY